MAGSTMWNLEHDSLILPHFGVIMPAVNGHTSLWPECACNGVTSILFYDPTCDLKDWISGQCLNLMYAWVSSVNPLTPFLFWHCLLDHAHSQRQKQAELWCITGPGWPTRPIQVSLLWGSSWPRGRLHVGMNHLQGQQRSGGAYINLRQEVSSLRSSLQEWDATIAELRSQVQLLHDDLDVLEQHGRRHSLCISGISMREEDTTAAVVKLTRSWRLPHRWAPRT